jgi:hypothetical protein
MLHLQVKNCFFISFFGSDSLGMEHCPEQEELFQEGFWTSDIFKQ